MFVLGIIFLIISLIAIAVWIGGSSADARSAGRLAYFTFVSLAVLVIVGASLSKVPTRNVGIVTQFGKPTGRTTGAGLQWTAPWQDVDDWDASGQTFAHLDACIWVTIAAQRRACIPVQVEWQARPDRAPENWAAYKEVRGIDNGRFGTFVARRVDPQINASLVSIFANFDPLGSVDAKSADAPAPDLNKLYRQPLLEVLKANLGQDIEVRSIAFGTPAYDTATTAAIADYGKKVLESRNLAVDKLNAQTRADITKTDASVPQIARCLQIAEKLGKEPGLCMGASNKVVVTKPIG